MIREEREIVSRYEAGTDQLSLVGPKVAFRGMRKAQLLLSKDRRFVGLDIDLGGSRIVWMSGQHEEVASVVGVDVVFEDAGAQTRIAIPQASKHLTT